MFKRFRFAVIAGCLLIVSARAQEVPNSVSAPQSPQLATLLAALDRNDQSALEAFWKTVEKQHSPLIEQLANRPNDALYTFLWKLNRNPRRNVITQSRCAILGQ
jgi:hypothetical protein